MKRVNVHLSRLQIVWLDKIAKEKDIQKAELIRKAIDDYIEEQRSIFGFTGSIELVEARS